MILCQQQRNSPIGWLTVGTPTCPYVTTDEILRVCTCVLLSCDHRCKSGREYVKTVLTAVSSQTNHGLHKLFRSQWKRQCVSEKVAPLLYSPTKHRVLLNFPAEFICIKNAWKIVVIERFYLYYIYEDVISAISYFAVTSGMPNMCLLL